jgi:glycosyltransferase involved in cell wall biosynthesis
MKICYLSNSAIPSDYASSIQIVKMCEAFTKLGNKVILISRGDGKNKSAFKYYDVKFKFTIKILKNFKTFPLGIKYYLFSIISIYESFKFKPEIYITRNFFTCFLLILFKKKIILELHDSLESESRIVRFLIKYLKFLNSSQIKKMIAITHVVKNVYKNKYSVNEDKILVLPSGSSLKKNFVFTNNKQQFKIGYFGALNVSRGLNIICELARIDKSNEYYLYGNIKNIKNQQKYNFIKNLYLHDYIPYTEISKALSKMDILLMPYTSSVPVVGIGNPNFTSPLKLFDYLSAGKIIICSNLDILKESIKDKKNAIFVRNFTNVNSWKKEIQKLKNQPYKQLIISKNNYRLSKQYSLTNRAKKILNVVKF